MSNYYELFTKMFVYFGLSIGLISLNLKYSMAEHVHEGAIFKRLVTENSTQKLVAKKMGRDKNTLTYWYKKEQLPVETWVTFGKVMKINVREEVPRLAQYDETKVLMIYSEDAHEYINDITKIQAILEQRNQHLADKDLIIRSLEQRIADQQELIRSQRETIDALTDKD